METWKISTLGDECDIIMGQSPAGTSYNDSGDGVPLINGPVEFGGIHPFAKTIRTKFTTAPTKMCKAGDLILCVRGSTTGRMNIAGHDSCVGRGVAAIRAKSNQDWVNRFISFNQKLIYSLGSGSTFPNVSAATLKKLQLPIPPLSEQKRIVAILDDAFERIDTAIANTEKNLANARELFESYLNNVFTQKGEGWEEESLAKLCLEGRVITYGVIKLGKEVSDGVPCLRTSNVRWLDIETDVVKRIAPQLSSDYKRTILQGGEVLVNVRGTLGGVAAVPKELAGWNVSREVAVVPVDEAKVHPDYLAFFMGTKASQDWLTGVLKGVAYTGINLTDLRTIPVAFPSLKEQQLLIEEVEETLRMARRLKSLYQQKLDALSELKQSILQKAFAGEL